jgi:hypothetical protein
VEASDADAARQLSFDGSLHQFGREERQRDRQIDLSSATFVACGNLLGTGDDAGNDLIKSTLTTRDGCDTSVARGRHGIRHDNIASQFHRHLLP